MADPQTVLVVEDDPELASMVAILFARRGYQTVTASDGETALDRIAELMPDAVILDIDLPRLSGWEVCRALKSHARTRDIPIIMLTAAHANREAAEVGLELGADEFVEKPFHGALLVHNVERLLNNRAQPPSGTP